MKSRINPAQVGELTWKEYVKAFQKDMKMASSKGFERLMIVVVTNFEFACGEIHALLLVGKDSVLKKHYKQLKIDRKKEKDFSIGTLIINEEGGSTSLKIEMAGFGKPNLTKKNSKKLMKRLGMTLTDVIKGEFKEEPTEDGTEQQEEQSEDTSTDEQVDNTEETNSDDQENTTSDTTAPEDKTLGTAARDFQGANKELNDNVLPLLKKGTNSTFTPEHLQISERAAQAVKDLVDKFEEVASTITNGGKGFETIKTVVENIVQNQLVNKYETILRTIQNRFGNQPQSEETQIPEELNEDMSALEGLDIMEILGDKLSEVDSWMQTMQKELDKE